MRLNCPECDEGFEIDKNEYDEGDSADCPECSAGLVLKVQRGQFMAVTDNEKYYSSELDEFFEED